VLPVGWLLVTGWRPDKSPSLPVNRLEGAGGRDMEQAGTSLASLRLPLQGLSKPSCAGERRSHDKCQEKGMLLLCNLGDYCPIVCLHGLGFCGPNKPGTFKKECRTTCGMGRGWFLEAKGLSCWPASSLFHILKDPDCSPLFPLTRRFQVPLWLCRGTVFLVLEAGAGVCTYLLYFGGIGV
jgi:hypothetical protein